MRPLININRGFEVMLPQEKEEVTGKSIYHYELKFNLFKKEFKLQIQINSTSE